MKNRTAVVFPVAVCLAVAALAAGQRVRRRFAARVSTQESIHPPGGFVPDAATATKVARVILSRIYGARAIAAEEPLVARRDGTVWIVDGSLYTEKGGVAEIVISVADCRILAVRHGK